MDLQTLFLSAWHPSGCQVDIGILSNRFQSHGFRKCDSHALVSEQGKMNGPSYRFGDHVKLTAHENKELVGLTGTIEDVLFTYDPIDMHLLINIVSDDAIDIIVSPGQVEKL